MFFSFKKAVVILLFTIPVLYAQEKVTLSLELTGQKLPFGLSAGIPKDYPKISIALSGGGSRGLSHLGVLKALEENDIPFESIFGTSMGSIIGGMYASGYNIKQIDSIVINTDWDSFFSIKEINRNELFVDQKITEEKAIFAVRLDGFKPVIPPSINTGQRVGNFLNLISLYAPLHVENNFSELLYDFKAICTNFIDGELVVLDKGSLSQAMRASSSVSLLLPPIKKDSMLLVDGGLVANIPVKPARAGGAGFVIASNTSSPLLTEGELDLPWKIADQMVSIPMRILNGQQLKEADVVIEPNIGYLKNTDFSNIRMLIDEGYKAASLNVELIRAKIKNAFIRKENGAIYISGLTLSENPTAYEKEIFGKMGNTETVNSRELLFELAEIYRRGYLKSAAIELLPSGNKNILRVNAVENPIVKTFSVKGVSLLKQGEAQAALSTLLNAPFNSRKTVSVLLSILSMYREAGYPFVSVSGVNFIGETGSLEISFDELSISELEVQGNDKTEGDIIRREFIFEKGNIKFDAIQTGLMNLRAANIFDDVEVYPHKENNNYKLRVDVKEKLSTVLRFGLRVDSEYMTQLSLDLRDENFLGTGSEFGFIFSGGLRAQSYLLEHKSNRVFDSYLTYKLKAFYDRMNISVYSDDSTAAYNKFHRKKTGEYTQSAFGISVGLGSQVGKSGNVLLETKYQNDVIKDNEDYKGPTYNMGIVSFRLGLSIDSQNKYPFATEGFLIKAYYETAQSILGSDIGYTKLYFDYKNLYSLSKASTFTLRFIIGAADNPLPLSQNFSLGGQNSFFGLREFEYRGRQIFLASIEYRYMLPFNLFFDTYAKLRYDLGSIWSEKEQIRFKDLRHGIGASLAFDTPVGPAEFSVGQSFYFKNTFTNNTIVTGTPYFYFSIGYNF